MDEWGIALVAFFGAIVGAVVGFIGLAWQHSAMRDEDVRKAGAKLLYHAEVVKNGYVLYRQVMSRRGLAHPEPPQNVNESANQVGELLRYIEIAASTDLYIKVVELTTKTGELHADMLHVAKSNSQIAEDRLEDLIHRWFVARNILAVELRHPGAKPIRWRVRQLKELLFRRN
ncbi:hypothetical protein [Arthrobacter sp. D2-10]